MSNIAVEGRRQAYLAALGIPVWTVRAESQLADVSDPVAFVPYYLEQLIDEQSISYQPHKEQAVTVVEQELPKPIVKQPVHSFEEPPLESYLNDPEYQRAEEFDDFVRARTALTEELKPTPTEQTELQQRVAVNDTQPITFRFAVYGCGAWQLIVPRSQLLSPSEMTLLANIQRVMQSENAPPLLFVWPMVHNYALPRHRQAAQEALVFFFRNQALSDKGYIVLTDHEQDLVDLLRASTDKTVIQQASLSFLLQQPLQKKALWLALNQ